MMMVMVTHARRELLRQPKQTAHYDGEQYRENVVPWRCAEDRAGKAERRAHQGAKEPFARGRDCGADIGLQNDDGADRSPVAVVQTEARRKPPAESRGKRGFGSVDDQAAPFRC